MPWLKRVTGQWLPELFSLSIGNWSLSMTPESLGALAEKLDAAKSEGNDRIEVQGDTYNVADVEEALEGLGTRQRAPSAEEL